MEHSRRAVVTGLMAPVFLGMAPILGKLAFNAGADPFTVAAWRTVIAAGFLWIVYLLVARRYIYIYPAGLVGCVVVGVVNGIGSLFYYGGLKLVDASSAQLLNGMYLIFVMLLSHLGGERLEKRIIIRVALATIALIIITGNGHEQVNWLGVGLMLANALMFAGTVILSQYVLYEMPAPTVTLYSLTTMSLVVAVVWVAVGKPMSADVVQNAIPPIVALALTTAASRIALFSGVKIFGSLQTAVLALAEIGVALALAFAVLGDRLTPPQVAGVGLLAVSILLVRSKDILPRGINPNQLFYNLADLQFQWIAFDQAFGKTIKDEMPTAPKLTTQEVTSIRKMMGASTGAVRPLELKTPLDMDFFQPSEAQETDKITFKVAIYYPMNLARDNWLPFRAYLFRESAATNVQADAHEQIPGGDEVRQRKDAPSVELSPDSLVTATLEMDGYECHPETITHRMESDWQRFDFYLRANKAATNSGVLTVSVNGSAVSTLTIG